MQRLETWLLIAKADRVLCHLNCDVFNCLFLLDVLNEIELLTRLFCLIHAGLFITLLDEKCTACQSHWKSDFGWHRFQK